MDERQIWAYGSWDKDEINCLRTLNVKNCDIWPGKGPNVLIGMKIDNANFLKNETSLSIGLKSHGFDPTDIDAYRGHSYEASNKKYANHGLGGINLKLLYDPIYSNWIHIYSDGNVDVSKCEAEKVRWDPEDKQKIYLFNLWLSKYLSRTSEEQITDANVECVAKEIITRDISFELPEFKSERYNDLNYYRYPSLNCPNQIV